MAKILITGATGYIGGSILAALLSHPASSSFDITVIVRDVEKANKLRTFNVNVVVGSHNDPTITRPLAEDADVVFTAADVDDMEAAKIVLDGMKARNKKLGRKPILIHTSGTGVLSDNAQGMRSTPVIYSDMDLALLDTIPRSQPHREVDLSVQAADAEGYTRTYIIAPSTIYGRVTGALVEHGISNPASQQIPRLIRISLARGQPAMMGAGVNHWPNVHIEDLTRLYLLIFDKARSNAPPPSGHRGFYFGAHGEHQVKEIAEQIGKDMMELGKGRDATPTPFTDAEIEEWFGPLPEGRIRANGSYGSNSRARADRGYALGWKPSRTTEDMLHSVRPEMEAIIAEPRL